MRTVLSKELLVSEDGILGRVCKMATHAIGHQAAERLGVVIQPQTDVNVTAEQSDDLLPMLAVQASILPQIRGSRF